MRVFAAFLTIASLLGAVITYQVGGYLPILLAVSMFEGFGLSTILVASITVEG